MSELFINTPKYFDFLKEIENEREKFKIIKEKYINQNKKEENYFIEKKKEIKKKIKPIIKKGNRNSYITSEIILKERPKTNISLNRVLSPINTPFEEKFNYKLWPTRKNNAKRIYDSNFPEIDHFHQIPLLLGKSINLNKPIKNKSLKRLGTPNTERD